MPPLPQPPQRFFATALLLLSLTVLAVQALSGPALPSPAEPAQIEENEQERLDRIAQALEAARAARSAPSIADRFAKIMEEAQRSTAAAQMLASTFSRDGWAIFDQCDERWGETPFDPRSACQTGCGPMAMAMVMTALRRQPVSPLAAIDYARDNGLYEQNNGSSWKLAAQMARDYGFRTYPVPASVEAVEQALREGAMVWMCGGGEAPFTASGHCIAIRGATGDGRWQVFDSKSGRDPDAAYDPSTIIDSASAGSFTAIALPGKQALAAGQ